MSEPGGIRNSVHRFMPMAVPPVVRTRKRLLHHLCIVLACLAPPSGPALAQSCVVASVHDGDTLRLACPGQAGTIAVRLYRIDAPELGQAHGIAARDFLRAACPVGTPAALQAHGSDRYRRTLGDLDCGQGSIQERMLSHGQAWVYQRYTADRALRALQDRAKAQRIGLWKNRGAIPPWEFRRRQAGHQGLAAPREASHRRAMEPVHRP